MCLLWVWRCWSGTALLPHHQIRVGTACQVWKFLLVWWAFFGIPWAVPMKWALQWERQRQYLHSMDCCSPFCAGTGVHVQPPVCIHMAWGTRGPLLFSNRHSSWWSHHNEKCGGKETLNMLGGAAVASPSILQPQDHRATTRDLWSLDRPGPSRVVHGPSDS